MAGGHGDGNEQVADLALLRDQRAIGDLIRSVGAHADVAFVLHITLCCDVALHVVAVDGVAAHADGIGRGLLFAQLVFGHDVLADHAAGLADVELVGPVAVVGEFIFRQAPGAQFLLHFLWHAPIIGYKPQQALLISAVLGDDLAAPLVAGFGIVVIEADVVEAEGAVIVRVGLVIRDGIKLFKELAPAGVQHAQQQFILAGIVAFGLGEGDAVAGIGRVAGAEAVGLHALVTFTDFAGISAAHTRQHAALRIARHLVGTDRLLHRAEVMAMVQHTDLDAVVLFAIDAVGLATDVVIHTCSGHKIALIGGVDEHLSRIGLAAECGDRHDFAALFGYAFGAVEPLVTHDFETELFDVIFKHLLRRMRLKDPHRAAVTIHRRSALAFVAVLGLLLLHPGFRLLIVQVDPMIKITRQAADDRLVSRVGEAKSATAQTTEMFVRRNDDHGPAHLLHLHGGGDRGAGAAINDDIMPGGKEPGGNQKRGE